MSKASERQTEKLVLATQRLAELKAQQLMREMRTQHRQRAQARRQRERRHQELGEAVERSGSGHFTIPELVGVLVDARERLGSSPTMLLGMRKKGAEWLDAAGTPAVAADKRPDLGIG